MIFETCGNYQFFLKQEQKIAPNFPVENDNDNTGNVDNNNAYAKSDNIDTDHF